MKDFLEMPCKTETTTQGPAAPLRVEAVAVLVDHAQALLDGLLEAAADAHDLADALHRGADLVVHAVEPRVARG